MTFSRRITLKQVAEAAGVSTQTVSRVLNNRPDVAPETHQRIQEIITRLGYQPNILARSLIQGRSFTLGVVAYGLDYYGPSRILTGIEQQADQLGYSIFLNLLHQPETNDVEHLLNNLLSRQVDGIIWAIPKIGGNRTWAQDGRPDLPVPIMFVGGMAEPASLPLVGIDNRQIGRLATEHLLAGGARHIGIVTGPPDWWEADQRQQGWREACQARGLPTDSRLVAAGDWSAASGEQGLYQLLAQCPDLDAVFSSNDQMALGVLHAAHRLGKRVPDDLSLVGVDNTAEAAQFWPALTTVRQRLREAGQQAVLQLDHLIQQSGRGQPGKNHGPLAPEGGLLAPELIVRESSRPVTDGPGALSRPNDQP